MLASESPSGVPPLIDGHEVEVALLRNDALTVRAFLDALRDNTIRSCGAQVAAAERAAVAATAANGRPRRSAASTASSHEAEALRARGELLQSDLAEAALLADADRQLAAADVEDADGSPPALDLPLGGPVAAGAGAASALPPALEHSGVSLYHSLFSKRVCVLKQLLQLTRADLAHAAQSRQNQGRHLHPPLHSATSSAAAARSAATGSSVVSPSSSISVGHGHGISPLLRWGLLSLFPLIDSVSRADPGVRAQSIRILLSVLRSAPPLSLAQEDEDTVQHMLRLLAPGAAGSGVKDALQPSGPPSAEVIGGLIGLSLQRGSLRHILASLLPLLPTPQEPSAQVSLAQLDVQPHLDSVAAHHRHARLLSVLSEEALVASWMHHPVSVAPNLAPSTLVGAAPATAAAAAPAVGASPSASVAAVTAPAAAASWQSQPLGAAIPHAGAICSDGTFLYVHSSAGLSKFGSGLRGSVQGHLYAHNGRFAGGDVYGGWLAHCGGALFHRSNAPRPAGRPASYLATKLDPVSLRPLGELHCSEAQMAAWPTDLEADGDPDSESSPGPGWFHMTSDGSALFFLREVDAERQQFAFTLFDPAQAVAVAADAAAAAADTDAGCGVWVIPHMRCELVLPRGWTSFLPVSRRRSRSVQSLLCPSTFFVDQKIDAKDSINKWCPAVVVQVTAARILVHYEGWNSKWDEWIGVDSPRIAKRGDYTDQAAAAGATAREDKATAKNAADRTEVLWSFRSTQRSLSNGQALQLASTATASTSSTATSAAGDLEEWQPLSALHSDHLESLLGTAGALSPFVLRSHRRQYVVHLSSLLMADAATGELLHLRRTPPVQFGQEAAAAAIEDVIVYATARQIVMCVPNQKYAAPSRGRSANAGSSTNEVATIRVFNIPSLRSLRPTSRAPVQLR